MALELRAKKTSIMALVSCDNCGNLVSEMASQCPKCGHPIKGTQNGHFPDNSYQQPLGAKSKTTAGILALCFGGLGVHYFYLV